MTKKDAAPTGASAESIAERIRTAILEHRLAPGTKLTEAQLCEVFGVKRGAIRQALALLATDRLVDLEPNAARSSRVRHCRTCTKCSRCGASSSSR